MMNIKQSTESIFFPIKFQENALGMMNNCMLESIFSANPKMDAVFNVGLSNKQTLYIVSESTLSEERCNAFLQTFFASDRRLRSFIHDAVVGNGNWGELVLAGNYLGHFPDIYGVVVIPTE